MKLPPRVWLWAALYAAACVVEFCCIWAKEKLGARIKEGVFPAPPTEPTP